MHIPVYRDITIISNTNIEFPIPPNIIARLRIHFDGEFPADQAEYLQAHERLRS